MPAQALSPEEHRILLSAAIAYLALLCPRHCPLTEEALKLQAIIAKAHAIYIGAA